MIAARTYVTNSRRQLREQANKVVVTIRMRDSGEKLIHEAVVTNYSDAPVWHVIAKVFRYTTMEYSDLQTVIEPGDTFIFETEPFWWSKHGGINPARLEAPQPSASVAFVDAAGYRWERSQDHPLRPQPAIFKGVRSRGYRIRKRLIPALLRHFVRDRWRAYINSRPRRMRPGKR